MDNPVAANVLGTAGAVCWSIQLIPQIILNYRRHHTIGLQPSMMLLWAAAGIPLGVYNISQDFNIALQIQPQILTVLSLITWAQCQYYREGVDDSRRWSFSKCTLIVVIIGAFMGAVELALFFGLREAVRRDIDWPVTLMAVLAAVLLCAGVLRHYWDIYKERTVRGISFLFVGIDALGDLTSLISVFFQPKLDILGMIIYGSELVLWLGIFACGGWFNFRPWLEGLKNRPSRTSTIEHSMHGFGHDDAQGNTTTGFPHHDNQDTLSLSSTSSATVFQTASGYSHDATAGIHDRSQIRLRSQVSVWILTL